MKSYLLSSNLFKIKSSGSEGLRIVIVMGSAPPLLLIQGWQLALSWGLTPFHTSGKSSRGPETLKLSVKFVTMISNLTGYGLSAGVVFPARTGVFSSPCPQQLSSPLSLLPWAQWFSWWQSPEFVKFYLICLHFVVLMHKDNYNILPFYQTCTLLSTH